MAAVEETTTTDVSPAPDQLEAAFGVVKGLVAEIAERFNIGRGDRGRAFQLYQRLVQKCTNRETMERVLKDGWAPFVAKYRQVVLEKRIEDIEISEKVSTGRTGRIYVDLGYYINQSTDEQQEAIQKHLLLLVMALSTSDEQLQEAQAAVEGDDDIDLGIDASTREGAFVHSILQGVKGSMENSTTDNPMQAITEVLSSGAVSEMIAGLQNGEGADLNLNNLMQAMSGVVAQLQGDDATPESVKGQTKQLQRKARRMAKRQAR